MLELKLTHISKRSYSASANRIYKRKHKSTLMWDLILISICLWRHVKHYWKSNIIDKPVLMTTIVITSPATKGTGPPIRLPIPPSVRHTFGVSTYFQINCWGDWCYTWLSHSLWHSQDLINVQWCSTDLPLVPGFWLVGQFSHIFRQTANRTECKFDGATGHMPPQASSNFSNTNSVSS